MRTVGIICECNPPHEGHFRLIDEARRAGSARVICVMSGCFVQRGEAAILDPFARAEILVRAGADVVLELPYPYSASSTEYFALAGVDILDRFGADELWFGSERGELDSLERLCAIAESEAFLDAYRRRAKGGTGTARAYFEVLAELCGDGTALEPNDILALAYLRAIRRVGSGMRPVVIKRVGSGYSEGEITRGRIPSATALRNAWISEGVERVIDCVPPFVGQILLRECSEGRAPVRSQNAQSLILGALRLCERERIASFAGLSGGLAGRLINAAHDACDLDTLLSLAATKKYPDATVRRAMLSALLEVDPSAPATPASYVRLLAATVSGCEAISKRRHAERLCVVTRQGDIPDTREAELQSALEAREKALYSLMLPKPTTAKSLLCHKPVILSDK